VPGTIAIDQTTRRLLGGLFEYRDLGGIEAKGFANRVQAYEVVRPSMVERRFEALRHSIQASPSSNERQAYGARIPPSSGSPSSRQSWPRVPMISVRPFLCSRTCCRSRPATAIRRSISLRRSSRRRRFMPN
jgi:hypothetical protein